MPESAMIAYKLTDTEGYTRRGMIGETLWVAGETVHPTGTGDRPCGPGVLHAYISPEVAVLSDPVHAQLGPTARLFCIRSEQAWQTDRLKRWTAGPVCVREELPLPSMTLEELVAWMIVHCPHPTTLRWAVDWLAGHNRSATAAWAATTAAWKATTAWGAGAAAAAAWALARHGEAGAETVAAETAAAAMAAAREGTATEAQLLITLARARAILAGQCPAEHAWNDLEVSDG